MEPRLPNFVVIGAPKAGTTSLHQYLRGHPEVFMPAEKELNFFIRPDNWSRGLDWYRRQFAPAAGAKAIGEASPRYTQYPECQGVAERMAAVVPSVRLVYVVRNPLDQMLSHYRDRRRWKLERASASRALLENPVYLETAKYAAQLERFLEHFPREQLHVVLAERLRDDESRRETMAEIAAFLDLGGSWGADVLVHEHNVGIPTRRWLVQRLAMTRAWDPATALVPDRLKDATRRLTHRTNQQGELPERAERELVARLTDDVARLRELVDAELDGWGIA
jgi:hypothetical protein